MRSCRSTSTHSPSRAPSVPSGRNPAALAFSTTRSAIERTWRSELPDAMTIVSAMSVSPRTSRTLTLAAFISSSAVVTASLRGDTRSAVGRRLVRVVMCLSGVSWWPGVSRILPCSIAPRVEDDLPYCIGNEIAGIAAGDQSRAQLGGGDLELRHRAHVEAAGRPFAQLSCRAGAVVDHELPERSPGRRLPPGPMGDDDVGEPEELAPAMPARQAEEGVHAEQQAQRPLWVLAAQLAERVDRVRETGAAYLAVVDHETRLVRNRGPHHREPLLRACIQVVTVRGAPGREETHLGEPELLPQLERGAQMPAVDRIEAAAEEADGLHAGAGRAASHREPWLEARARPRRCRAYGP